MIEFRYREVVIHNDLEDFQYSFVLGQAHKRYVLEFRHNNGDWSTINQLEPIKKPA